MTHMTAPTMPISEMQTGLDRSLYGGLIASICVFSVLLFYCIWQSPVAIYAVISAISAGVIGSMLTLSLILHRQKKTLSEIWRSAAREVKYAHNAADMAWETDLTGTLTTLSGRLIPSQSDALKKLLGQPFLNLIKIEGDARQKMTQAMQDAVPYSDIQSLYHDPDGRLYYLSLSAAPKYDGRGEVQGYVGVATNITERVLNERRLKQLAENDTLTGLANRHRFNQQIRRDLDENSKSTCLALLAIDLDGFKQVNDTYGHQTGDALLNLVGKRLKSHVRDEDWAARLGGDEFMVVARGIKDPMDACLMAARLIAVLSQPYHIGGIELRATASIGIACAPAHAQDPTGLMKYADCALYQAKSDGRNRFSLYTGDELSGDAPAQPQLH